MGEEITQSLLLLHKPEHVETRLCRLTVLAHIYIQTPPTQSVIQSQQHITYRHQRMQQEYEGLSLPPGCSGRVVLYFELLSFLLMCRGCFPVSFLAQVFQLQGTYRPLLQGR